LTSPHRPSQHNLDNNTATQIKFRNDQAKQQGASTEALIAPPARSASGDESDTEVSSEPIKDPNPEDKKEDSMAQRAKGFLSDGAGRVDMSAVLSGLGAVESSTAPAPPPPPKAQTQAPSSSSSSAPHTTAPAAAAIATT
jgi:hypothetical protein